MKYVLILLALSIGSTFLARADDQPKIDCAHAVSQMEMNACAAQAADAAAEKLNQKINKLCAASEDVSENRGGSIYPLELSLCVKTQYLRISKGYKKLLQK